LIRVTGLPQLGMSYTVGYQALPSGVTPVSIDHPILVSGLRLNSTPVPVLSGLQPPNCLLLTSTEVLEFMPATSPTSFQSQAVWTVPNNPILVGFRYHHQWASLYSSCRPTCTPMMIRVSNGAMMTVGL